MKGPLFYSKILLFGEYGIIKDSKGLSIPYNFYNGALKVDENLSDISKNRTRICGNLLHTWKNCRKIIRSWFISIWSHFEQILKEVCISTPAFLRDTALEVAAH